MIGQRELDNFNVQTAICFAAIDQERLAAPTATLNCALNTLDGLP